MGQKMAQGAGLTARQKQLLGLIVQELYYRENFYLTGGTALSSWYLHHRESYDLDLFSESPFDYDQIRRWFRKNESKIGSRATIIDEDYGFLEAKIRYPDNERLKVDFNHYGTKRLRKGLDWKGLAIDSLFDIAANKIQTIFERPRTRDYVDVYFIFQNSSWPLSELITAASKKFHQDFDLIQLEKNFLKVTEYVDLPKMLVPFDQKEMEKFYENLAKSLRKNIFK